MKQLPKTENALVLRTDFSDQSTWERIRVVIREATLAGYRASVDFLDDVAYQDITKEQLLSIVPTDYANSFIILVDRTTISSPEFPLLVVDLQEEPGREFRTIPSMVPDIEANLSLANLDFSEYADRVDQDGVFRGGPWFVRLMTKVALRWMSDRLG